MNADDPRSRFFARTMHTPDDPARAALRAALRDVSRALLPLHRALIEAAKAEFAASFSPVSSPTELLRLLQDDPFFVWLKPMTSLIVDIDEMVRTDFERSDVEAIAARADELFGPSSNGEFSKHYVPLLQREMDVTTGHAAVRKALAKLVG